MGETQTTSEFLDLCVKLTLSSNDELIQNLMDKSFETMDDVQGSSVDIPEGVELIKHKPSRSQFTQYASKLMRMDVEREDLLKEMLKEHVENLYQSISSNGKRKRIFEPNVDVDFETESEGESIESEESCSVNLPLRLQPATTFYRGKMSPCSSMVSVSREYFPGSTIVYPGVHKTPDDSYVLYVIDNGKYPNVWVHENGKTTLTWISPYKDAKCETMLSVSRSKNIYVFRKRANETFFRYMGKSAKVKNTNTGTGKIDIVMT